MTDSPLNHSTPKDSSSRPVRSTSSASMCPSLDFLSDHLGQLLAREPAIKSPTSDSSANTGNISNHIDDNAMSPGNDYSRKRCTDTHNKLLSEDSASASLTFSITYPARRGIQPLVHHNASDIMRFIRESDHSRQTPSQSKQKQIKKNAEGSNKDQKKPFIDLLSSSTAQESELVEAKAKVHVGDECRRSDMMSIRESRMASTSTDAEVTTYFTAARQDQDDYTGSEESQAFSKAETPSGEISREGYEGSCDATCDAASVHIYSVEELNESRDAKELPLAAGQDAEISEQNYHTKCAQDIGRCVEDGSSESQEDYSNLSSVERRFREGGVIEPSELVVEPKGLALVWPTMQGGAPSVSLYQSTPHLKATPLNARPAVYRSPSSRFTSMSTVRNSPFVASSSHNSPASLESCKTVPWDVFSDRAAAGIAKIFENKAMKEDETRQRLIPKPGGDGRTFVFVSQTASPHFGSRGNDEVKSAVQVS